MNKKLTSEQLSWCNSEILKAGITIEFQESNGNLYCLVKRKKWFMTTKRYVRYLGLIRGQYHEPLIFSPKKDEFMPNINEYPKEFIEIAKDELLKYVAIGGRTKHACHVVNDFIAICGYAGEAC